MEDWFAAALRPEGEGTPSRVVFHSLRCEGDMVPYRLAGWQVTLYRQLAVTSLFRRPDRLRDHVVVPGLAEEGATLLRAALDIMSVRDLHACVEARLPAILLCGPPVGMRRVDDGIVQRALLVLLAGGYRVFRLGMQGRILQAVQPLDTRHAGLFGDHDSILAVAGDDLARRVERVTDSFTGRLGPAPDMGGAATSGLTQALVRQDRDRVTTLVSTLCRSEDGVAAMAGAVCDGAVPPDWLFKAVLPVLVSLVNEDEDSLTALTLCKVLLDGGVLEPIVYQIAARESLGSGQTGMGLLNRLHLRHSHFYSGDFARVPEPPCVGHPGYVVHCAFWGKERRVLVADADDSTLSGPGLWLSGIGSRDHVILLDATPFPWSAVYWLSFLGPVQAQRCMVVTEDAEKVLLLEDIGIEARASDGRSLHAVAAEEVLRLVAEDPDMDPRYFTGYVPEPLPVCPTPLLWSMLQAAI